MRTATTADLDAIASEAPPSSWTSMPRGAPVQGDGAAPRRHRRLAPAGLKVDVNAEPELAGRFPIRSVPTLMIVKAGKPADTRAGARVPSASGPGWAGTRPDLPASGADSTASIESFLTSFRSVTTIDTGPRRAHIVNYSARPAGARRRK
jgi:hypothetical protein